MSERDYGVEVVGAIRTGDFDKLGALALELLAIVNADKERRTRQAHKKRRQRGTDGGHGETGADRAPVLGTSPPHPLSKNSTTTTPSSTPAREAAWAPVIEERIARRLASDADRLAFAALLAKAPNKTGWALEVEALLDGMHGPRVEPVHLGEAIRDFVANDNGQMWSLRHFRTYVQRAKRPPGSSGQNGNGPKNPGEATYENARAALEN